MVLIIYTVGSNSILVESKMTIQQVRVPIQVGTSSVKLETFYHVFSSKLWSGKFSPFSYGILITLNNQVLVWVLVWYFQVHQKQPKIAANCNEKLFWHFVKYSRISSLHHFRFKISLSRSWIHFIEIIMVSLSLSRYEVIAFNSN